jgi:hypothetical protein
VSTYSTAHRIATARRRHWIAQRRRARAKARLYVHETQCGRWVVREEYDRCGGTFLTQAAALKFIRSEFGADVQIVATNVVQKEAA